MQLALNVGAMLIAFAALIALLKWYFRWRAVRSSVQANYHLVGVIWLDFQTTGLVIGVPWEEATVAGQMIGTKLAINEFVVY